MPENAAARRGRRRNHRVLAYRRVLAGGLTAALAVVLAACGTSHPPAAPARIGGGMATVALQPGEQVNWLFPLINGANDTGANIGYSQYLIGGRCTGSAAPAMSG
jgi:hypothetical protein